MFNKNGGGFRTHVTFSMKLFVTIVLETVIVAAKSYLIDEIGFMDPFLKKMLLRFKLSHKWKILTVYIL